jgi:hypothetical protein
MIWGIGDKTQVNGWVRQEYKHDLVSKYLFGVKNGINKFDNYYVYVSDPLMHVWLLDDC